LIRTELEFPGTACKKWSHNVLNKRHYTNVSALINQGFGFQIRRLRIWFPNKETTRYVHIVRIYNMWVCAIVPPAILTCLPHGERGI
jgi:hypothetical protein